MRHKDRNKNYTFFRIPLTNFVPWKNSIEFESFRKLNGQKISKHKRIEFFSQKKTYLIST